MAVQQQISNWATDFRPSGCYRRRVAGADFSLEANTKAVPEQGIFYVLRRGRVVCQGEEFEEVFPVYRKLCGEFWEGRLECDDPDQRLASAWGLIEMNPAHEAAAAVIQEEGDPAARKRLQQIRNRHAYRRRRNRQQE